MEASTIFPIAAEERTGTSLNLFLTWYGANQGVLTVLTGVLYTSTFHLPFGWAVATIFVGNLVGSVFMALHAAQGAHLGIPQMQQTRAQFGAYGALLVIVIVILMYVGFFSTLMAVAQDQVGEFFPFFKTMTIIPELAILSLALCTVGYQLINRSIAIIMCGFGGCLLVAAALLLTSPGAAHADADAFVSYKNVMGGLSIGVLWQIAYAPYVSDYSRYMPIRTGNTQAFWSCLAGTVAGTLVPMAIGAFLGANGYAEDVYGALARCFGPFGPLFLAGALLSTVVGATMQIYCAALSTMTLLHTLRPTWRPNAWSRAIVSFVLILASSIISFFLTGSILTSINDLIAMLLYVLAPWTAINLVDYYVIRRGDYDMVSMFQHDGGIYSYFNWTAVGCYVLGICVQIPFVANDLYTGAIAQALGGADLSWVAGVLVPGLIYAAAMGFRRERAVRVAE